MQEVRVESLEGLERLGGRVRLSANAGSLRIDFPEEVWERAAADAVAGPEPTPEELAELDEIRVRLERHARQNGFKTVLKDVRKGSAPQYDLVLEPSGLLAATTGYLFAPVVDGDLVGRVGLEGGVVEQAYLIGATADEAALAAGDEALRTLSVRGRRCGASRFEMPPELWQVLSRGLGWRDVETFVHREE
ncbi:MAG: hypothetical protein AVDCRST_MAG22-3783 [uncultured Rubrobacteraceae bacterium]|uniref:Uncharacterized protein n=1 Tax=uncultured Rubrobacteraceae bacterium TaxID=349277 RepID=A0A6J4Q854_9ACTN|nr:MAG: hypothetical protein AVDCRST_MAG22-3783 [uncultured Rubrobacteraceae bacterium]